MSNRTSGATTQKAQKTRSLDPQRAALMGKIGGNTTAARYGGYEMTRALRDGLARSWERKADPLGVLSPAERARAAEALKQAHYARMRLARWGKAEKATPQRQQKKAS